MRGVGDREDDDLPGRRGLAVQHPGGGRTPRRPADGLGRIHGALHHARADDHLLARARPAQGQAIPLPAGSPDHGDSHPGVS